jgi:single-strand DNA-binding protein
VVFHFCVVVAEITERHLHKGTRIAIVGTLYQNKWESGEGVTKSNFQIICNTLEFIKTDGRGFNDEETNNEGTPF